jgi:hypothetical protein
VSVARYNPDLIVAIDGTPVATSAAGDPGLLAVDKLSLDWGRERLWEHATAGQCSLSLLDAAGVYGPHTGASLMGRALTLSYQVPGVLDPRVFFRGRITEVDAIPRGTHPYTGANRGLRLDLSVASKLAQAAIVLTPPNWARSQEALFTRWSALRDLFVPGVLAGTIFPVATATQLAARTYDAVSALDAMRAICDATTDRSIYNPHTDKLELVPLRINIDQPAYGYTVPGRDPVNTDGVVLRPAGQSTPMLDAGEFSGTGKLLRGSDAWVTGDVLTYYPGGNSSGTPSSQATTYQSGEEAALGPNRITIDTDLVAFADVQTFEIRWANALANEARRWRPDLITHETRRVGGLTLGQIPLLLDGMEHNSYVFRGRQPVGAEQHRPDLPDHRRRHRLRRRVVVPVGPAGRRRVLLRRPGARQHRRDAEHRGQPDRPVGLEHRHLDRARAARGRPGRRDLLRRPEVLEHPLHRMRKEAVR